MRKETPRTITPQQKASRRASALTNSAKIDCPPPLLARVVTRTRTSLGMLGGPGQLVLEAIIKDPSLLTELSERSKMAEIPGVVITDIAHPDVPIARGVSSPDGAPHPGRHRKNTEAGQMPVKSHHATHHTASMSHRQRATHRI